MATHMITCTAATLRAVLCYIDSGKTPRIAYDRDDMVDELIEHIKNAVGDAAGSQSIVIPFRDQDELCRQFVGVCNNIKQIMNDVVFVAGEGEFGTVSGSR